MTALNFQKQFADKIISGDKTQTIRKPRKHPIKEGDLLQLYTGMRTKQCKLLATARCENVIPITIYPFLERFSAPIITPAQQFIEDDGFRTLEEFFEFFQRYEEEQLNFEIIYWKKE